MPHPIVEGLDDLLLEVARTRVSVDHGPAFGAGQDADRDGEKLQRQSHDYQ